MYICIGIGLALFALWLALERKTSRPDGDYISNVHKYRMMMQFVMPTRNESLVYYDAAVNAEKLLQYIEEAREEFHTDVTHCLLAATANGLRETPEMNRFPMGHRLYQRKGNWITFSMKRKKMNKKAKLATVKKQIPDEITFRQLCELIQSEIHEQRSDKVTYHDKEYNLLTALPRPLLKFGVWLLKQLDYYNILPKSFIDGDALYTSVFLANLGSIGLSAGFHHLYEWGNCPLFILAGKIEERAVVIDGQVSTQTVLPLRFTYDERIDDGLTASHGIASVVRVLEDPYQNLGCLQPDGSDHFRIGRPSEVVPIHPSQSEE